MLPTVDENSSEDEDEEFSGLALNLNPLRSIRVPYLWDL